MQVAAWWVFNVCNYFKYLQMLDNLTVTRPRKNLSLSLLFTDWKPIMFCLQVLLLSRFMLFVTIVANTFRYSVICDRYVLFSTLFCVKSRCIVGLQLQK